MRYINTHSFIQKQLVQNDFVNNGHKEFHERINENADYRLQIPALVPEIFKFEKYVKYANAMTEDVIHSTQYYIMYINRAILANL